MTSTPCLLLLVALVGVGATLSQARAAPLDADTCTKLVVEHGALESAGVEETLTKGPAWAKANLPSDKIDQVRRFIELEELIQFRCRSKSRVTLPPDPEDKDKDQDKDQDNDQAKAGKDKGAPGKEGVDVPKTQVPSKAKGPATKTKDDPRTQPRDPKGQPKALPKKQDSPVPKAKSAGEQPPKSGTTAFQKRPPKAKAEEAPETASPTDDNPFGKPFAGKPQ